MHSKKENSIQNISDHHPSPQWLTIFTVVSGLSFIIIILVFAFLVPNPSDFQTFIIRVILALAASAFGAAIPGFINMKLPILNRGFIRAGGAIAFFILVYMINPPELIRRYDTPKDASPIEQQLCGIIWYKEEPLQNVAVTIQKNNLQTKTDVRGKFCFTMKAEKEAKVRLMMQKEGFETMLEDATLGNTNLAYRMEFKK